MTRVVAPASTQGEARTPTIERVPDPVSLDLDAYWEERWQQDLLRAAAERVKNLIIPGAWQMLPL